MCTFICVHVCIYIQVCAYVYMYMCVCTWTFPYSLHVLSEILIFPPTHCCQLILHKAADRFYSISHIFPFKPNMKYRLFCQQGAVSTSTPSSRSFSQFSPLPLRPWAFLSCSLNSGVIFLTFLSQTKWFGVRSGAGYLSHMAFLPRTTTWPCSLHLCLCVLPSVLREASPLGCIWGRLSWQKLKCKAHTRALLNIFYRVYKSLNLLLFRVLIFIF